MGTPRDQEARRFYFVARQRREDARLLFKNQRFLGAMYLAGYTVECVLKSLLIATGTRSRRKSIVLGFRGKKAHNLEDLRKQVLRSTGGGFPDGFAEAFQLVVSWSPDLRYQPGIGDPEDAKSFLNAVDIVFGWADGRL